MKNNNKTTNCLDMKNIDSTFFLIGLISEFNNRFQSVGDGFFKEISWRQVFALTCITFFEKPPTIRELTELLGGSHQNTKQILSKLEKAGFVKMLQDDKDGRKQRIILTKKAIQFQQKCKKDSSKFMQWLFEEVDSHELEMTAKVITQLDDKLKQYQEESK